MKGFITWIWSCILSRFLNSSNSLHVTVLRVIFKRMHVRLAKLFCQKLFVLRRLFYHVNA